MHIQCHKKAFPQEETLPADIVVKRQYQRRGKRNEEEAEEGMRAGSHLEEMGFRGGSSAVSLMLGIR